MLDFIPRNALGLILIVVDNITSTNQTRSRIMATRLSVHAEFAEDAADAEGSSDLKRKAWLAVFAGSSLFWLMVALVVWRLMS